MQTSHKPQFSLFISFSLAVCLLVVGSAAAAPTQFAETWESYTNGVTPYGSWQLQTGTWGSISTPGVDAGQCYSVAAGQKSRIVNPVDLDSHNHVVLQGWLYDSGGANRSVMGLGRTATTQDNSLIRMGAGDATNYTIQFFDINQSASVITVDTGLPTEAGWHFMRLDIVYDGNPSNLWNVTWRTWNAAQTVEQIGSFGWYFDKINCNYVTLGAAAITPGMVAWDDLQVGSIADVWAPPSLPQGPWPATAFASSQIPGWEATNAIDSDQGTVWSSVSRGTEPNATEWLVVDYGQVIEMTGVSIGPRPGGACFPVDYRIDYSADGVTWATVPGMVFTNQPNAITVVTHDFSPHIFARAVRIYATRLSPDGFDNHYLQLAEFKAIQPELWAAPAELRGKKVINAAQYSTLNLYQEDAPTPAFLADHPDYLANHPFDGLSVPILLDRQWLTSQGLMEAEYALQDLVMTKLPIPWSQVSSAVADLNRVNWGHVTDNFLWYRVSDSSAPGDFDTRYAVDPASSSDWAVVAQNAALCARVCREAVLKGFMMDTEMYTNYAGGELYPFGKGTPEVWRERGQQWIEAIQSEFPGITIIFFFSWGPESEPGGWPGYENLKYFMNGVLAGVQAPARLIHGWESTFWWGGQRYMGGDPNDPDSYNHYPGDRAAYAGARNDIKNVWRNLSDNPAKYDQFVEAGMAAFVDSDPYNLWPGWPSGYLTDWPWSNLPYTLAYSDSYVWVWAAHTHYSATRDVLNPFLASIANQTFNTGREAATYLIEDFETDPLVRGWYFDFDMLSIGRHPNEEHGFPFLPVMTTDSVAYKWDPSDRAVRVKGAWMMGLFGSEVAEFGLQRRRYVHPLDSLSETDIFHAELDFKVEDFGSDPSNPILLGLFNSDELVDSQSINLLIDGPASASVTVVGDGVPWVSTLSLTSALSTGTTYRVSFDYDGTTESFQATLTDTSDSYIVAQEVGTVPANAGQFDLDEVGAAMWDAGATSTPPAQAYQYLLENVTITSVILIPGDFDHDGDVDQSDFGHLQMCFTGMNIPLTDPACEDAQLDVDSDVDLDDLNIFADCISGANMPANPNCAN